MTPAPRAQRRGAHLLIVVRESPTGHRSQLLTVIGATLAPFRAQGEDPDAGGPGTPDPDGGSL